MSWALRSSGNGDQFAPERCYTYNVSVAKWKVTLYCEQQATVECDLPHDATPEQLQAAALAALDASGGVEWQTLAGYVDHWERIEDGRVTAINRPLHSYP